MRETSAKRVIRGSIPLRLSRCNVSSYEGMTDTHNMVKTLCILCSHSIKVSTSTFQVDIESSSLSENTDLNVLVI